MARHATITDDQILEAARAVFLEEGYGAQTAKIARRAGISEGSIFKRFPTKEALFSRAFDLPLPGRWHQELDRLVGVGNVKENLVSISQLILSYFQEVLPSLVLRLGSRVETLPPLAFHKGDDSPPVRDARVVHRYLQREVAGGRLRACDTELLAHLLLGMLSSHVFRGLMTHETRTSEDYDAFAQGMVDILWEGVAPGDNEDEKLEN